MNDLGISVIIPTRNRAVLLERAVFSILQQTYKNIEIIIIDDGSSDEQHRLVKDMISKIGNSQVSLISLPRRENGHGPSFSRNTGVKASKFSYIAFLDDDDEFISSSYLDKIATKLSASAEPAELILSNQIAIKPSMAIHKPNIWLEKYFIGKSHLNLSENSSEIISKSFFNNILEFAHINTMIMNKHLFERINGFDESIRYEEDRDLFYRLIISAENIWATGIVCAKHYIPEARKSASSIERIEKLRLQSIVFSKSMYYTDDTLRLNLIVRQLQYIFREHVDFFVNQQDYKKAIIYARLSNSLRFDIKWFCYTKYLQIRALTTSGNKN